MKVFLSWSGDLSHEVALAFREWLPSVIQSLEPYVSSEDINKGARWSVEMATELEKSRYGIICVTEENVSTPWINFEAGALSRSIEKSTVVPFSTAVSPFLFDLKSSDLAGPLTQFQYVVYEKADIYKLVQSINGKAEANQLSAELLERAFERWWPDLKGALDGIAAKKTVRTKPKTPARSRDEILDELLELLRGQQRVMVSKDDLISLLSSATAAIRSDILTLGSGAFVSPYSIGRFGSVIGMDNQQTIAARSVIYPENVFVHGSVTPNEPAQNIVYKVSATPNAEVTQESVNEQSKDVKSEREMK